MKFQVGDIVRYRGRLCRVFRLDDGPWPGWPWIHGLNPESESGVIVDPDLLEFVLRPKAKPPKFIAGDIVRTDDGRVVEVCGTDSGFLFDEAGLYLSPCDLTLLFRPEAK